MDGVRSDAVQTVIGSGPHVRWGNWIMIGWSDWKKFYARKSCFLRRNMVRIFFFFWQALRGVAAILLLGLLGLLAVALVTYLSEVQKRTEAAPNVSSGNRPGWVCGKILGTVIEVPSSYVLFWAEYEGKSSWEKGFTENKKGCDANFSSVSMALSWPYLLPVRTSEYTTTPYGKFQGVVLTLEQIAVRHGDLDYLINNMLEASASKVESADNYQKELGLFSSGER